MWAWWNSLEKVSTANVWVLGFASLFGFMAAILVIASWLLGTHAADLQQQELTKYQTDANTRIATANQVAAQANARAAELGKETEELRNQNLELQRRINPRFLTTTEQSTILGGISPFPGHQIIVDRLGDGEAGPYGDSIIGVLRKANWSIQINHVGMISPPIYGIVCQTSSKPDEGAEALIAALKKAQIPLTVRIIQAASSPAWVELLVGLKPIN